MKRRAVAAAEHRAGSPRSASVTSGSCPDRVAGRQRGGVELHELQAGDRAPASSPSAIPWPRTATGLVVVP